VAGDPAVDAAATHARRTDPISPYLAPFQGDRHPTLVAGSTWEADEAVLLPALARVKSAVPLVRVVVAPHEPTPEVVGRLVRELRASGWRAETLAEIERRGSCAGVDAVVVERVGVLAHLYSVADVAYVGGGFGTRGLHSVLEPAAARVPVVFGPRWGRSAAAGALLSVGGARSAPDRATLAALLTSWLTDAESRKRAAEHAFVYIDAHRGAAGRTADLLDPLLPRPNPTP
jgi:3-deoxy-D-manno-octulosonic-acid transferase